MTYPKWVQRHRDLGPILAANAEEEAEYSGMTGTATVNVGARVAVNHALANMPEKVDTVESVRAKLDAAGIKYHHKAGLDKLKELLPKD